MATQARLQAKTRVEVLRKKAIAANVQEDKIWHLLIAQTGQIEQAVVSFSGVLLGTAVIALLALCICKPYVILRFRTSVPVPPDREDD